MLSITDIRTYIQDKPEINRLLGREEFSPEQIKNAIKFATFEFNETPPMTDLAFDEADFPYPGMLLTGILSILILGKSMEKYRNRLAYQTDGVNIDDEAMADPYYKIGMDLKQEFLGKIKQIKIAENIKQGFGHVPSDYSSLHHKKPLQFI